MTQRIKQPKQKADKTSGAIAAARHTLGDSRLLLEHVSRMLKGLADVDVSICERMAEAHAALSAAHHRLGNEYKFLKWKEDKIARGEWRGDAETQAPRTTED